MSATQSRKTKRPPVPEGLLELDVLTLNGQEVDLNYYFTQDYSDISQAAEELPNLIEWINGQLQVMYEDKLNAEQQLKKAEAEAFFDLKGGTYTTLYGGKATEKSLAHAVTLDENVQNTWKNLNVLSAWCRRLQNLQNSLTTKLDLIRSSEATRRRLVDPAELELDRMNERKRREEENHG
jgi:hypothetical protein